MLPFRAAWEDVSSRFLGILGEAGTELGERSTALGEWRRVGIVGV